MPIAIIETVGKTYYSIMEYSLGHRKSLFGRLKLRKPGIQPGYLD